ncbi:MAG: hypothetical protein GY862_31125 [Gammaproteobacteria bacterium]|nr:hypothetical protein [Gammaproteobacteria bacterium]
MRRDCIDTVLLHVGPREQVMEVLLLSPAHPLRIAWLYQFETLVRGWMGAMEGKKPEAVKALIDADVLDKLTSIKLRDRHLHIDLIEVKNRKASSPAEILKLQDEIRDKNASTEQHFRHHYLGSGKTRLDAPIKNKELANILLFYFDWTLDKLVQTSGNTQTALPILLLLLLLIVLGRFMTP